MKRKRYLAHTDNGPRHILAYSMPSAVAVAESQGWGGCDIRCVKRGELSKARVRDTGGGWKLDPQAIEAAKRSLGIKRPLAIQLTGHEGGQYGAYGLQPNFTHKITVKRWLSPIQASATIWHELCHAAQAERSGSLFGWAVVNRGERGMAYESKPTEREARDVEGRAVCEPLVRAC